MTYDERMALAADVRDARVWINSHLIYLASVLNVPVARVRRVVLNTRPSARDEPLLLRISRFLKECTT